MHVNLDKWVSAFFSFAFVGCSECPFRRFVKEQLREKEQRILELERKLEDKERELHAIRLDNEAVCLETFCVIGLCEDEDILFQYLVLANLNAFFVIYFSRHGLKRTFLESRAKSYKLTGINSRIFTRLEPIF